jgi:redox-sensitive bicupin YhaK (pirin superfamily)
MMEPKYQELGPDQLPVVTPVPGVTVKVIAGQVDNVQGPISQPATDPTYLDVGLQAGAGYVHVLPAQHAAFLFVYDGAVRVGSGKAATVVSAGNLAVLGEGTEVALEGVSSEIINHAILVAGRPLREPVARYGPFVMNTREQLIQAVEDFQSGRF